MAVPQANQASSPQGCCGRRPHDAHSIEHVVTPLLTTGHTRAMKLAAMNMSRLSFALLAFVPALAAMACDNQPSQPEPKVSSAPQPPVPPATKAAGPKLDKLSREEFNRLAPELALPLFWKEDANKDGALDPSELAVYWGLERGATLGEFARKESGTSPLAFTPKMYEAYERIVKQKTDATLVSGSRGSAEGGTRDGAKGDDARRAAVKKELAQGRVTLVATDLSKAEAQERKFVAAIMKASELIEALYAKQQAVTELAAKVPAEDLASKTLFFRGQGAKCEAPLTQNDPACGALLPADMPKTKLSGLYPADLLAANPKFCEDLQKQKDKALLDPFTVVVKDASGKGLAAKPFHEAWPAEVQAIAKELEDAAHALEGGKEHALQEYLLAAAKGFGDDAWWPADEMWAKMDAKNSKYYLRIGPDEVYDEPCSTKALYHVSFGLINQGSLKWQQKLDPLKTEMENALAAMAGKPYTARAVSFKLPDFVDIALNAGDSRKAFGATIGQSLPNFGPVANGGRGRTVAMTNFYTDPDSIATAKEQGESLFCKDAMARWTSAQDPQLMSTVLHEAAHNLGPAHQYKANGKIDREAFGGPLASTLEELKAQTAALFFTDWLIEKKQITRDEADQAHVRDMFWAFGHISRGMYGENNHPKNYSQLAAIQLGWLLKEKAVTWKADETAANGKDKGCFSLDLAKMPVAIKSLMTEVAQIKGQGNKARAEALIKEHVGAPGEKRPLHTTITERITRAPKASFVYSVKID
ncbi:MAG: Nudix hydrolase 3 [Labilithrix sp.]|nr:Nudix hydrolase 3 [Labilithrix sp.]